MSAFLDITEDADMEDGDLEPMMDPDAPDNITGERSFRYGPSGRPIGGDSWLGKWRQLNWVVTLVPLSTINSH